jgi:hypothetical protein
MIKFVDTGWRLMWVTTTIHGNQTDIVLSVIINKEIRYFYICHEH